MIIHQRGKDGLTRLVQASHTRVVDRDGYSLTVETTGLTDKGDPATYRMTISNNEIALLHRAMLKGEGK